MKHVVIVGAGFAGLKLARKLRKNPNFRITLIDKYNFHQFQPLFYQAATGRIEPSNVSFPLRKVFQKSKHVRIRLAEVRKVNTEENKVETSIGSFNYDYLVIATGCTTNFFGNKEIEKNAFPMKSTYETLTLQNRILTNFEDALSASPNDLKEILNIVIVGGGPTGVELAGALAEMKTNVLPKDYRDINFSGLSIYLIEGSEFLLNPMSDISHKKAKEYLEKMGVDVILNSVVTGYDGRVVKLQNGSEIISRTLIWAAGVTGNTLDGLNKEVIQRGNRIKVDRYNKIEGLDNVYVIGDVAYMETPKFPRSHPQVANVAISQAVNLANNFEKMIKGKELKEFEFKDPGSMATIGKYKAVVDLPWFSFQGIFAWITWMFLHLMLILGVRNKMFIFFNWAFNYINNDTTLRIILRPSKKDFEIAKERDQLY